jgi:hypothetical protein
MEVLGGLMFDRTLFIGRKDMYSTYPTISKFTPALLKSYCKHRGITIEALRLGTLKTVECSLDDFLKNTLIDLHEADRDALELLHRQVRLVIGDE